MKLLNKPLRAFAIYALIILVVSIPVYVFVVDHIWTSEIDENNWLAMEHTKFKLQSGKFSNEEVEHIDHVWGELQPGLEIKQVPDRTNIKDSVYEAIRPNIFDSEGGQDRFRGLKSYIRLNGALYELSIETNVEESDETFLGVAVVTLIFFVLLILGFIFLNRRISTKTWKPFYNTLRSLRSFELSTDKGLALEETDIQEFNELNRTLTQLVKNNVDAFRQQRSFTENASHELQTPIALIRSKLDLLFQQEGLTPEVTDIINGVEAPLAGLSRLNKNLLLLARIENRQYGEEHELEIGDILQGSIELFEDYLSSGNFNVNTVISGDNRVKANSFLLETMIQNLLSNAIRHTEKGGRIRIVLKDKKLSISNPGEIPLDTEHLYERFSTTSKSKVSSGLGLAIIKEIANRYGWQVGYHFGENSHTFSVAF